jgi:hypothetical protein
MVVAKSIGKAVGTLLAAIAFGVCVMVSIPIALVKSAIRAFKWQFNKYCKYYNEGLSNEKSKRALS